MTEFLLLCDIVLTNESMGVASIEAEEAVASSLFCIMTRVSGVVDPPHTPRTMCVRFDDRDRS